MLLSGAKALVQAALGGNVPWPEDGEDEPIVARPPPAVEELEQARGPPRKHMKSLGGFSFFGGVGSFLLNHMGILRRGPCTSDARARKRRRPNVCCN